MLEETHEHRLRRIDFTPRALRIFAFVLHALADTTSTAALPSTRCCVVQRPCGQQELAYCAG